MFTGLVSEIGRIARRTSGGRIVRVTIAAGQTAPQLKRGDSVAVAGACLTVESVAGESFTCAVIPDTLTATRLGRSRVGDLVNLELPIGPDGRLGGHLVTGHVDTVGRVTRVKKIGGGGQVSISFVRDFDRWVVEKGSIAVEGISLTVAERYPGEVVIGIIPTTWQETTIGRVNPGSLVNVEFDQAVKAVLQGTGTGIQSGTLSEEWLWQAGW